MTKTAGREQRTKQSFRGASRKARPERDLWRRESVRATDYRNERPAEARRAPRLLPDGRTGSRSAKGGHVAQRAGCVSRHVIA